MKSNILIFSAIAIITFCSCKNETKKDDLEVMAPEETDIMEENASTPDIACYRYTSERDTVLLQMEKIDDEVVGTLSYNYFEKDNNDGTFEGKMVGDTLFANYTFGSEGTVSVRELMFIKKGNNIVEGFGEVEDVNGEMKFKKNTKYTFNDSMPLKEIDCDEN